MIKLQWIKHPDTNFFAIPFYDLIRLDNFDVIAWAQMDGPERTNGVNSSHGNIGGGEPRTLSRHISHLRASIEREVDRRSIELLSDHDIEILPPDFRPCRWTDVITERRKQWEQAA